MVMLADSERDAALSRDARATGAGLRFQRGDLSTLGAADRRGQMRLATHRNRSNARPSQ